MYMNIHEHTYMGIIMRHETAIRVLHQALSPGSGGRDINLHSLMVLGTHSS